MYRNTKHQNSVTLKLILLYILNIILASSIFYFSSQPASVSGPASESFTKTLLSILTLPFNVPDAEIITLAERLNGIVRKCAHFSIYTAFGACLLMLMFQYRLRVLQCIMLSSSIGLAYALSDEIHQIFSLGRSCEFRDVMIDFGGVITGILIIYLIKFLIGKFNKV